MIGRVTQNTCGGWFKPTVFASTPMGEEQVNSCGGGDGTMMWFSIIPLSIHVWLVVVVVTDQWRLTLSWPIIFFFSLSRLSLRALSA